MAFDKPKVTIDLDEYLELQKIKKEMDESELMLYKQVSGTLFSMVQGNHQTNRIVEEMCNTLGCDVVLARNQFGVSAASYSSVRIDFANTLLTITKREEEKR